MKRRDVITLLGGAAAGALSLPARAQQTLPVIGVLSSRSLHDSQDMLAAFAQGLHEAGFAERQNVTIEHRWADGHYEQLPALAADLVKHQVALIIAVGGVPSPKAAKAATATIPIVFVLGGDPVQYGLVESLNRPGGNVTGVSVLTGALTAKRLEILRELTREAGVIGCLINPVNPESARQLADIRAIPPQPGQDLLVLNASTADEIETAFASFARHPVRGLLVGNDAFFVLQRAQMVALAARHAIPTMYFFREFAAAGGLMSYGNSLAAAYRQVGVYAGRILKGARPADLPVEQAVKIELIINLKTAKALGIEMPTMLLARADEVIE